MDKSMNQKTKLIQDFRERFTYMIATASINDPKVIEEWLESSFDAIREEEKQELIKNLEELNGACNMVCWYTHKDKEDNPHILIWLENLKEHEK